MTSHPAPPWLVDRLRDHGGWVPFSTYMDWVLHDPVQGAYGSGRLQVGPRGDFATSPSLGPDFAALLAPQIAQWLQQEPLDCSLALVETGPGEGHLALQLAEALAINWPALAARTELVLVEPNGGMAERQRRLLAACPLPCRWLSFEQLALAPVCGVMLAHEVLDALPVERIVWDGAQWRRQGVSLGEGAGPGGGSEAVQPQLQLDSGEPLSTQLAAQLEPLGLAVAGGQRAAGWCSELHPGLRPWLQQAGAALKAGQLLVVDYAHEAWRYYAPQRSQGTLMAYRQQGASNDPLLEPGHWDLTAHLCIETLVTAATSAGWGFLGQRRQGEALLALGLAQRLHGLQQQDPAQLPELLSRREALLRLVDPTTLGDFRWLAFARGVAGDPQSLFLQDPPLA